MKNIFTFLILILFLQSNAQTEQTHIPASKSIVGIWRQTGFVNPNNGETVTVLTGNYKLINPDGTYFTFVTWGSNDPINGTTIGKYGTYEVKSDELMVEHTIKHVIVPSLSGKSGEVKYKLIDENTLMMAWQNDFKQWVNEKWTRLPLSR